MKTKLEAARDALIVIESIASGSRTVNSLPNLARIAREALTAIENSAGPHAVKPWYERCNWNGTDPAVLLMHQAMKAEIVELRAALASGFREGRNTSSESVGKFIAAESAGREPLDVEFKRLADTILQATTNGTRLEALRGIAELFDKCAAREPAPVARDLDVEAEHLAAIEEAAQTLESAAAHNRSKGRTVFAHAQQGRADRLRIALKHFGSQSTAESAPASAAPDEQSIIGKLLDGFSEIEHLWGLNEPGALVRHRDVFNLIVAVGKAAAPSNSSPVGVKEQDK